MRLATALALGMVFALATASSTAQNSRDAEQRLKRVRTELQSVAAERRKIEGQRGDASRQLRAADEQVGRVGRTVEDTEHALARESSALADLQQRRDTLQATRAAGRDELRQLLRAAYTVGEDTPLKTLLAQDRLEDAHRTLAYHRYAQRDRASRIRALTTQLQELDVVEQQIAERRTALDASRRTQRAQLASLERARRERASLVASLDARYQDKASREKALGQDAKALQSLLTKLRAAAAKAAAEKAAADRAARAAAAKAKASGTPTTTSTPLRRPVVTAPAPQVGGLGWPVAGSLVSSYGGTLPDGRRSEGVLIAAAAGTTVKAVADGRVVFADWMNGYGLILIVDHGNGYMSLYAHNDALLRDAGDAVRRGDPLASVGNSGGQGRTALYFELRRNGQPVDPGTWLQRR